ncbi:uncharacterized protein N7458_003028 [Penicillium daleae]|uniref:Hydrophobin n=1 Tax=Penicillium daleae TaxID=63821 RepID=A0AAD6CDV6_9EURO|nr:uncharacterized protein N7458_003028 [Penicillium daleae]KAJ5461476.1 hypothetical protein N7458_003028 [Penicillium daleae]
MHLPTLFYTLATLAITAAVPVTAENSTATPTATQAIDAPSQANPVATPSMTPVGAYRCPPKQFKRCCLTLQQTSRELIDGLGELVPVLGGLSVSSLISFDCKAMADDISPNDCDVGGMPRCAATPRMRYEGFGIDACKPFEQVKEKYYRSFGFNKGDETQADTIEDAVS